MSDQDQTPQPAAARRRRGGFRIWGRVVLFLCLVGVVGYVAADALKTIADRNLIYVNEQTAVANTGLTAVTPKTLASQFADSQGRLLADPPASADKLLDPDTLTIAHLGNSDEIPGPSWDDFKNHLQDATGKKIDLTAYTGSAQQFSDIAAGKITLAAVHAADAPFLVDNYGFEPVAVLGDQAGANGNHLDIIVPASSSITTLADLKGHSLACTAPSSITGYRAAITMLMQDQHLRPNVDYFIVWSMKQKDSIQGVCTKNPAGKYTFEAAAVSDDKLQTMIADGKVQKSQFRMIYQSSVIPRTTIGYFYNLKPELAGKVRQAILNYNPAGGPDVLKFLPMDYKNDFQFVRDIDDSFDPRLDSKLGKAQKD